MAEQDEGILPCFLNDRKPFYDGKRVSSAGSGGLWGTMKGRLQVLPGGVRKAPPGSREL